MFSPSAVPGLVPIIRGLGGPSAPISSLGRRLWPIGRGAVIVDVDGVDACILPGLKEKAGSAAGV